MRQWITLAPLLAVLAVACNRSPEGGTPGTSSSFTITAPALPTTVKQENKDVVKMSLDRKGDFKKDVKISVTAPEKIDVDLTRSMIKASEPTDFTLTVKVAKDAPLGDHIIKVIGTPEGGGTPTSVDVKIKVEKNS